jgi:crotonobetainyl-CoA:carnitine CoA-transferase CaiB-like acyl-CoA transferase
LLALRDAQRTGMGQVIDVPLYASVFRLLDELVPAYAKFGEVRGRHGADVPHVVPHGHWQTQDDRWIALACSSDKIFARLASAMDRQDLIERFATNAQRIAGRAEVNAAIAQWAGSLPYAEVLARCDAEGVPCGPIMTVADIFEDPHYAAREDYQRVEDERVGEVVVPSSLPRLSRGAPELRHLGGALGAHTEEILRTLLGMSDGQIDSLRREGAI